VKNTLTLWKSLALTVLLVSMSRGADATITVHADRPGIKVSPTLYGIFFEEINRGGEGGLYAEMVSNRSFEDSSGEPSGWNLIKGGDAEGSIAIDTAQPLNESNPHALRLDVKRGRVGVANSGFGGIAIKAREQYVLTLYARGSEKFTGPLNVTLENSVGRALATATIDGISPQWQKLTAALKSGETDTDPAARLVISSANPGTIWLDVVSLFPKTTWKDRGLRGDIADKIAAMKPAFFRFPGGCWVEGEVLDYSYHWKQTVGDVAARKNNYNIWKYSCTNGLGFHEYLQFCEDIGAEPLFVINCGMSHKQTVPMSDMKSWVQDAIDAIEYCNGSATDTKWGRDARQERPPCAVQSQVHGSRQRERRAGLRSALRPVLRRDQKRRPAGENRRQLLARGRPQVPAGRDPRRALLQQSRLFSWPTRIGTTATIAAGRRFTSANTR
jgi:hypothetical protein